MKTKNNRLYKRLDKSERKAIENGLDKRKSCRQIAADLGRSASTISDEVSRNRTVSRGENRGERVDDMPTDCCPKLDVWPHVCNGCKYRHYHCSRKFKCEYSAYRAQALADTTCREARQGIDKSEEEFEHIVFVVKQDISRGLSPAQIANARADEFDSSVPTIYRWIDNGYFGMSKLELRRSCKYKPRQHVQKKQTSHGPAHAYTAFLEQGEEVCASACEMDTVIGLKSDKKCLLTLYHRPSKFQFALLLNDKTSQSVVNELNNLETLMGKAAFKRVFGCILTDNGTEFSDTCALEKSALPGVVSRCNVYYCDVRASQQKGGCERNHVELRKLLPKRKGISFDNLTKADCAVVMSQLNSEPRPSLNGCCAIDMFRFVCKNDASKLLDGLGIEKVDYENLLLSPSVIKRERKKRTSA